MADGDRPRILTRRRAVLAGMVGAGATGLVNAISGDGQQGDLFGGTMALQEAYKFAEGPDGAVWIGPDSAKSNVPADSGNVYMAADTQVDYYGDSGAWTKLGVGSSSESVPDGYFDTLQTGRATITEDIDSANVPYEIYVGFGGSDSNTGLSKSESLATLNEALKTLPALPIQNYNDNFSHDILLDSSETFTLDSDTVSMPWGAFIRITSEDSNRVSVELAGGSDGLNVINSRVWLNRINFSPADTNNLPTSGVEYRVGSVGEIRNCDFTNVSDSNHLVRSLYSSWVRVDSNCTLDGNGNAKSGVEAYFCATATVDGTVKNCTDRGVFSDGSSYILNHATLDNTGGGAVAKDNGHVQVTNSTTIQNCTDAVRCEGRGSVKVSKGATFSSNTNKRDIRDTGMLVDNENKVYAIGWPHDWVTIYDASAAEHRLENGGTVVQRSRNSDSRTVFPQGFDISENEMDILAEGGGADDNLKITGTSHRLDVDEKVAIDPNEDALSAYVRCYDTSPGSIAEFDIRGANNDVIEMTDTKNRFSTSEGTTDSLNIYWDSTNSRYELENGFSGVRDVVVKIEKVVT